MKKLAILDTDFISKTHTVRVSDEDHLIDKVLALPGYDFFCHEQTKKELGDHNSHAPEWLDDRIQNGAVVVYTDERLIREMSGLYYRAAPLRYTSLLKNACDPFGKEYFKTFFSELDGMDYWRVTEAEYLQTLKRLDKNVGKA